MAHYLARRHLNLSPTEWDRLPWYEQDMYLEGFAEEGLISNAGPTSTPHSSSRTSTTAAPHLDRGEYILDEQVHRDGDTTITERVIHHDLSGEPGEFAAQGFTETPISL